MTALSRINSLLPPDSLFRDRIALHDSLPSTNTLLRELALRGAPEGTVVLAEEQTAGRGTGARSFYSRRGDGLYLSLLLRPAASLPQLLTLTGRTAVAVREGIFAACGAPVSIKWLNDILLRQRKVCGILTELGEGFVVMGIGVNTALSAAHLREQGLGSVATSLSEEGFPVAREALAAHILSAVEEMYRSFPGGTEELLSRYRAHCSTVGRSVSFLLDGVPVPGTALGIGPDFSLTVRDRYGTLRTVSSGTVTLLD